LLFILVQIQAGPPAFAGCTSLTDGDLPRHSSKSEGGKYP
jgi:hypothetical protein